MVNYKFTWRATPPVMLCFNIYNYGNNDIIIKSGSDDYHTGGQCTRG